MQKSVFIGLSAGVVLVAVSLICIIFFVQKKEKDESPPAPSSEKLKSLPYLIWVPSEESSRKSGITRFDPDRAFRGLNIYNSRNLSTAYLMDMSGNIVHTWSAKLDNREGWQHVKLCNDGGLLAVVKDRMLVRMDWNSRLQWALGMRFHHDVALAENKNIYSLIREDEVITYGSLAIPFLDDRIVVLSPEGEIRRKISLFQVMKQEIPSQRWEEINRWIRDPETQQDLVNRRKNKEFLFTNLDPNNMLHTNTLEIVDRDIDGLCGKGDFLVCCLKLDLIGIIDSKSEKLIWKWGPGILNKPHHPTLLRNGNILIFDNGADRGYSRIVELDPLEKEIVWQYQADPPEAFFSLSRGASQRLPNGNTLITESDRGRVFEVTSSGEVVWEFFNPETKGEAKKRAAIYRLMRIGIRIK